MYFENILNLIYNNYSKSIKDYVYEYLENEFPSDLIVHFKICSKFYHDKIDRIEKLLSGLRNTNIFDDDIYKTFLLNSDKSNPLYIRETEFICKRTLVYFNDIDIDIDNPDMIIIASRVNEYRKLAIIYNLVCANDYNALKSKVDEVLSQYISLHGKKIEIGTIDLSEELKILKNEEDPYRFFIITHYKNKNSIINGFDHILKLKHQKSIVDLIGHLNEPSSEKYPWYKQKEMENRMWIINNLLSFCISDSKTSIDLYLFLDLITKSIQNCYFKNMIDITIEVCGSLDLLKNVYDMYYDSNKKCIVSALLNACCVNLCGTIEKILRNVALLEIKENKYFNASNYTLVPLLSLDYKVLSKGLIYYLEFFLSKENNPKIAIKEERPGKDLRNIHMHNHDYKYGKTSIEDCLTIFNLLLSLLGDIYFNIIKEGK